MTKNITSNSDLEPKQASENITVLVFKDNYAARTLSVPPHWILKFGIALTLTLSAACASILVAIKYYRIASRSDLNHIQDLEQEIVDLRNQLKSGESKNLSSPTPTPALAPITQVETTPKQDINAETKLETDVHHGLIFSSFPSTAQLNEMDPSQLPFQIQAIEGNWSGKKLNVHFALQYKQENQGTQEGRILIIARGPETYLSFPPATLSEPGTQYLLSPEKGEFFSVSRFRAVEATFGPLPSKQAVQYIEIFIFNLKNQLLTYKKLSIHDLFKRNVSSSESTFDESNN